MKFFQAVSIILFISFLTIGCGSSGGGGEDPPSTQSPSTKTTTVSGTVLDDIGNPIVGAEVTITSNPVVVFTDVNGKFIATVEIGSHNITVKFNSVVIYTDTFTCYENIPLILSNFEGGGGGSTPDTNAPSIPTNLSVISVTGDQVMFSWGASTDNVGITGYKIYRNGTFLRANNTTSFSDTGLNFNTQYCYSVSAYDASSNESGQSSELCALTLSETDTSPPSTPSNLQVTAMSSSQIDLSWGASTDNIGVITYKVYRDGTYSKAVASTSTSDAGLSYNTQYCYSVSAYDAAGNESLVSNQRCVTTLEDIDTSPPPTPANIQITVISSSQIDLNWMTYTETSGVIGYKIYRNGIYQTSVTERALSNTGLSYNTEYCYSISAYDAADNESGQSSELCATTFGFYYDETVLLIGKWHFEFYDGDAVAEYTLTTITGDTNVQDGYRIYGTDAYGNTVFGDYWPDRGDWIIQDNGPSIDSNFVFDTDGTNVLNGCYYQRTTGTEDWSPCYPLYGYKVGQSQPNDGSDNDGDGYTENQGDCDDADSEIYPGASEICGDGIDQNCNGNDLTCSTTLIPINTVTTSSVWEVSSNGDIVELMNGSIWDVSLYSYRSWLWFMGNDIVVCNGELINLDKDNSVKATLIAGTSIACTASEKYYITDISSSNDIIWLNNGSIWEVDMFDKFDVFLWMTFDDVVFTSTFKMVNIDSGESVGVTQIK